MAAKILIIEDNSASNELMVYLIRAFGYTPLSSKDGEQGLQLAEQEVPDLILCDIELPKIDGFEIVQRLRKSRVLHRIPIIAVTALAMVGDRNKVLAAGFNGYISKPIDPSSFIRQIESFLHHEDNPKIGQSKLGT